MSTRIYKFVRKIAMLSYSVGVLSLIIGIVLSVTVQPVFASGNNFNDPPQPTEDSQPTDKAPQPTEVNNSQQGGQPTTDPGQEQGPTATSSSPGLNGGFHNDPTATVCEVTDVPPATKTPKPPTFTKTSVPPTATKTVRATNTVRPPTATKTAEAPTHTSVPPTNTQVPPTSTQVPPTNTQVPPTNTSVPPTSTEVPPTLQSTPENTPTHTATSPKPTEELTPTSTATVPANTATPTATATQEDTATPTSTATPEDTGTPTVTPEDTATATVTPSETPTATLTPTEGIRFLSLQLGWACVQGTQVWTVTNQNDFPVDFDWEMDDASSAMTSSMKLASMKQIVNSAIASGSGTVPANSQYSWSTSAGYHTMVIHWNDSSEGSHSLSVTTSLTVPCQVSEETSTPTDQTGSTPEATETPQAGSTPQSTSIPKKVVTFTSRVVTLTPDPGDPGATEEVLIPVTGGDFSGTPFSGMPTSNLFINFGIVMLGIALSSHGITLTNKKH